MSVEVWKIGDLARRAGVSVRTLHHYDALGLLPPERRTRSGHRLYTAADVERLQRILSLRQLGFPLEQIRSVLDNPACSTLHVARMHLAALQERIAAQQRLVRRLEGVAAQLGNNGEVSVERFFEAIKEMTMLEKYYTPEQLEELARRREQLGEERIQAVEREWADLIDQVRAEMNRGSAPTDPRVQALARQWKSLIEEFTGGDPEILQSLKRMYADNPNAAVEHGYQFDGRMAEYIGTAMRGV